MLGPGDVFDTVRMKISKLRLENTRFFDDVKISTQATNIPGRRKHARRGQGRPHRQPHLRRRLTAHSSAPPSSPKFRSPISTSSTSARSSRATARSSACASRSVELSSEVVLSFEEPYLFQKQLALGFSLFRTSSDYNSSFYTQIETGGEVYLRKHLFELFEGKLSYEYEVVDISNVASDASPIIAALAGQNRVSKVSFQLLRDTRDKIVNTTFGNRIEVDTSVAGGPLGGDTSYYSLEFRGSQFFPVFEAQTQVLSLIGRFGVIQNYGSSRDVPYYSKFYLGGPYDLRGFEYRDVSPRDVAGEPVGGKSYGMFSAEYSMDIVSPIRFAIFYDAGFVNSSSYDFNPGKYNDDFGVGLRLFVAGAPLSLDFGIPLTSTAANRKGNQFNFSFGTRF